MKTNILKYTLALAECSHSRAVPTTSWSRRIPTRFRRITSSTTMKPYHRQSCRYIAMFGTTSMISSIMEWAMVVPTTSQLNTQTTFTHIQTSLRLVFPLVLPKLGGTLFGCSSGKQYHQQHSQSLVFQRKRDG